MGDYATRTEMVGTVIGELTSAATDAAQATRGVVQALPGATIAIVWNAVTATAQHRASACKAALMLRAHLEKSLQPWNLSVSIGLASSKVVCGMVGSSKMRRFDLLGAAFTNALALSELAATWSVPVLCDPYVAEESSLFLFCIIGRAKITTLAASAPNRQVVLAELLSHRQMDEEEWMYQLDAAEKADPYANNNKAWLAFLTGDNERAKTTLSKLEDPPSDLKEMIQSNVNGRDWNVEYPVPFTAKRPGKVPAVGLPAGKPA
eukprot:NODE_727_length_1222_cov_81.969309_g583_i0.p1 GENE.NODE_727_length_1222_cov_81.969309_g583_i0~~NODE_727_length_1222_cov_81.969309_g583_i0.p1  ORF type:complete len:273 (-),score=120.59 NODE_727_length_1222_cov_81.969309_g583_i0:402-1190(-)